MRLLLLTVLKEIRASASAKVTATFGMLRIVIAAAIRAEGLPATVWNSRLLLLKHLFTRALGEQRLAVLVVLRRLMVPLVRVVGLIRCLRRVLVGAIATTVVLLGVGTLMLIVARCK